MLINSKDDFFNSNSIDFKETINLKMKDIGALQKHQKEAVYNILKDVNLEKIVKIEIRTKRFDFEKKLPQGEIKNLMIKFKSAEEAASTDEKLKIIRFHETPRKAIDGSYYIEIPTNNIFLFSSEEKNKLCLDTQISKNIRSLLFNKKIKIEELENLDVFEIEKELDSKIYDIYKEIHKNQSNYNDAKCIKKFNHLLEVLKYSNHLKDDGFELNIINKIAKYRLEFKRNGITDSMPKTLIESKHYDTTISNLFPDNLYDKKRGYEFGNLRIATEDSVQKGDSVCTKLSKYMEKNGGDYDYIDRFYRQQAGSSFCEYPKLVRSLFLKYRNLKEEKYYFPSDGKSLNDFFDDYFDHKKEQREKFEKTILMFTAFTAELLHRCDFPGKNSLNKIVQIYRTELLKNLESSGIKEVSDELHHMPRVFGASGSIIKPVLIHGGAVTVQQVPLHRIIATYFTQKFGNDSEKEFICMLDDIPFTYSQNSSSHPHHFS